MSSNDNKVENIEKETTNVFATKPKGAKPKGKPLRSVQTANKHRLEDFRKVKGKQVMDELEKEMMAKYKMTADMFSRVKNKETSVSVQEPISTRGVGLAAAIVLPAILKLKRPVPVKDFPIAALYRVDLAMVEAALQEVSNEYAGSLGYDEEIRTYDMSSEMRNILRSSSILSSMNKLNF
ncbi:hypothetical protein TKK_0000741 [Trichogramma kaykai]